jgi:hypothetical protein
MTRRLLFVLCLISLSSFAGLAQARRTVTNADLDKYRQARIDAERQLNEDYSRLGFASPEVRAQQNAASVQQLFDLSQRLKSERLERERVELENERLTQQTGPSYQYGYDGAVQPGELFYPTTLGVGRRSFDRGRGRQQQGYFAGGQFWPQGPRTPLRPLFRTVRPAPRPAPHH